MAFILFPLGTGYRGSRIGMSVKNMQWEKKKKKGVLFPEIILHNQCSTLFPTKIYITEEHDVLCGFQSHDHFHSEIFELGSSNVVASYIVSICGDR